jgi:pseudouridine kinase
MTPKTTDIPNAPYTSYVCVIGGSNIDIEGYPRQKLLMGDSNPGVVKTSLGGVGRNIAENLARLGIETKFLSVVGDDAHGRRVLDHAKAIGLDMDNALVVDEATSTYLSVLDETREMHVGIAYMDILDKLDIAYIQEHEHIIQNAAFCVVDTNLPEILEYLVTSYAVPFVLDTVSASKAVRAKHLIGHFHTIKLNKLEAEILSGISIQTEKDLQKVGRYFMDQGVGNTFVTMAAEGAYYKTEESEGIIASAPIDMVSASGAGDAFAAGLVYGLCGGKEIEENVKFAIGSSIMAIRSEETIHPHISSPSVEAMIKDMAFTHQKF